MNLKKIVLLLILAIGSFITANAQFMPLQWQSHYQGPGDNSDRFNQIKPDGSNNYVAVGYTVREGNYRDYLTVKFNSNGDTLWWATRNGRDGTNDVATGLEVDVFGNIYVVGYSNGGNTQNDILLLKYDQNGVLLWDTLWDSPASLHDEPADMAMDLNGNIFITGFATPDTVQDSRDYITLKISPTGALLWQAQWSRPGVTSGRDEATAIALDSNGDCYVTGRSRSLAGDDDIYTFKYDGNSGAVLFSQIYNGGNGHDRGVDIVVDNAGDIIVTGRTDNGNNQDFRTIKYNNTGGILWSRFYNGPANQHDRPVKLCVDAANNVYVTGESDVDNSSLTDFDFVTLKYSSLGTLMWVRFKGSNAENDTPADIFVDGNGDVFVTGRADMNTNPLVTNNDFMTVKYNNSGTEQWTMFHSGSRTGGSDTPSSLYVDASGNCYVAGGSENVTTQKDATVVKYASNGNVVWTMDFNGKGDFSESGRSIVIDANDNAYIGGYSFREDRERDIFLIKLNTNGDTVCTYLYDGTQNEDDELSAIAMDANGFIYATGYTKSTRQKSDIFTMKWDPNTCQPVWIRLYNYSANESDRGISLVVDAAGNVYVTGRSDSNPLHAVDNNDIVTIKYDSNGNQIWLNRYDGPGSLRDEPSKIMLDNSGNVLVCGRAEKANDDDFVLLKYNAVTGNMVWADAALYNGPFSNDDRALDMTIDANDNIFVCGYSQTGSGAATDDAAVIRFDPAGNATDFFLFDGIGLGNDQAVAITNDNQNQIYVTLRTDVDPNPVIANYNYLTIKFDNNLNQLWGNPPMYNGPLDSDDIPLAITVNATGSVFVTGYSKVDTLNGRTNIDWTTVRYDSNGIQSQIATFDGALGRDDEPNAMAMKGNSLWVTGFSVGSGNNQKDLSVLRYDLTIGMDEFKNAHGKSAVYPNPFSHQGVLEFSGKQSTPLQVQFYDVLGQVVLSATMDEERMTIPGHGFAKGMYLYQILDGNIILDQGKFVVE